MTIDDAGPDPVRISTIARLCAAVVIIGAGCFLPWLTAAAGSTNAELMLYGTSRVTDADGTTSEWAPPLVLLLGMIALFVGRYLALRGDRTERQVAALRTGLSGACLILVVAGTFYTRKMLILGPDRRVPVDAEFSLGGAAIVTLVVGVVLLGIGIVGYRGETAPSPFALRPAVWIERTVFAAFLVGIGAVVATMAAATYSIDGDRVATAGFDGAVVGVGTMPDGSPAADVFTGWNGLGAVIFAMMIVMGISLVFDQRIANLISEQPRGGRLPWIVAAALLVLMVVTQIVLGARWSMDAEDVGVEFETHVGSGMWALAAIAVVMGLIGAAVRFTPLAYRFVPEPTADLAPDGRGIELPDDVSDDDLRLAANVGGIVLHRMLDEPTYFYRGAPVSVRHRPPLDLGALRLGQAIDSDNTFLRSVELSGIGEWAPVALGIGDASVHFDRIVDNANTARFPLDDCPIVEEMMAGTPHGRSMMVMRAVIGAVDGRPKSRRIVSVSVRVDANVKLGSNDFLSMVNAAYDRYVAEGFASMTFDEWVASPAFIEHERPSTEYRMKTELVRVWRDFRHARFHTTDGQAAVS